MKPIVMIVISIALGGVSGCSSTSSVPVRNDVAQGSVVTKDLGILETSWGKKRCFESLMAKTYVAPLYPTREKRAGVTGRLAAAVYVGKNGRVIDVSIMTSSGSTALDSAGKDALMQWTYEPVIENGSPIEFVALQRMTFMVDQ